MGLHLPPTLALFLTLGFIAVLFWRDIREQRHVTSALWIPLIWLTIIGSRYVSEWLAIFGLHVGAVNVEDGSPIDSLVFGLLIVSGLYVLSRRRVSLAEVIRNNRWMTLFLVYCFLATLWSDFPLVALKRWLKDLGLPILVLVVLTEPDPEEALVRLLKRCAYVWVPVSILFIKYFPQWGRSFDSWTGAAENSGIAGNKNMLGLDLFIAGVFFFWYFLKVRRMEGSRERRNELILAVAFLGMIGWLLRESQSSTSLVSFLIAAALMLFLGLRWVNPRNISAYLLAAMVAVFVAVEVFDIYAVVLHLLRKSSTLTDRTLIWNDLLQTKINPILGAGFESFWLGDEIKPSHWLGWNFIPNEAHNAYLETYLNLGLAGLFLLIGWFVAIYQKARRDLLDGLDWGLFRLAFLVAALFYGWTEAAFRSLDAVYFVLFLIATDYPKPEFAATTRRTEAGDDEAGVELLSAQARILVETMKQSSQNLSHT